MTRSSGVRAATQWPALLAVSAMVIGFTYSDDLTEFGLGVSGVRIGWWRLIVVVIDIALLAAAAFLKWRISTQANPGLSGRRFLSGLIRSWWALGAGLVLVVHLLVIAVYGTGRWVPLWGSLLLSTVFVAAMGLVLASALDTDATPGVGWTRHGWVLPLVIGTFVVQVASALWFPVIDVVPGCANEISTDFFAQTVQVLPVLLVTLGIEMSFLRRRGSVLRPADRAAPVLTVLLLCVAEALAFSMLVKAHAEHCGTAAVWHEYTAFVVSVQAMAIGLATLAWLLVADSAGPSANPG